MSYSMRIKDYCELFIALTNLDMQRIRAGISIADLVRGTPYSEEKYQYCVRGLGLAEENMVQDLLKNLKREIRKKEEVEP